MAGIAPAALVTSTARQPLPYGLFSVATPRPGGDRWENGVTWEPGPHGALGALGEDDCDDRPELDLGDDVNVEDALTASSFTVYGYFHGNPVGFSPEAAAGRALEHLVSREESRVEKALWTGDLGNSPSLAGTATELDGGAAQGYVAGLGLLENYLASEYGSLGVIHMTRQMALVGLGLRALEARNGRLTTGLGTPVVAGAGYDGSDTDGDAAPDDQSWVYITPSVFFYRGEPLVASDRPGDLLARSTNTLYAVAERSYVVGFDSVAGVGAALLTME